MRNSNIRLFSIAVLSVFIAGSSAAQDGTDIDYVKPAYLKQTFVGRTIQLDFFHNSFVDGRRNPARSQLNLDKVTLDVGGKQIEFLEHREDDGFNNVFSGQYLVSIDKKLKLRDFTLLEIGSDSIRVAAHFTDESLNKEFTFPKTDLAEILVKVVQ